MKLDYSGLIYRLSLPAASKMTINFKNFYVFKVIWSYETKINRFESDDRSRYWTGDLTIESARNVRQTIKNEGGLIMVRGIIQIS